MTRDKNEPPESAIQTPVELQILFVACLGALASVIIGGVAGVVYLGDNGVWIAVIGYVACWATGLFCVLAIRLRSSGANSKANHRTEQSNDCCSCRTIKE